MQKLKSIFFNFPVLIFLVSIPTVWALLVPGYFGASDDLHIGWLDQMDKVIKMGQFPPRYVPDLSFGFGYPLFNFVYPLPFYIAEIFHLMGLSLVESIKAVFLFSMPFSAWFMYLLLREFCGKYLSLAGAVIYLYAPYRANDLYNRGAIGEIVSFAFLPVIFLAIVKIANKENSFKWAACIKWIGIGSLSLAALILTHNITAYMFLPFAMLFALIRIIFVSKDRFKVLAALIVTLFFSLTISMYFWLPALLDSNLVKYDTVFNYVDHFPTIRQLITPFWGYGASVAGPYDGMSFFLGWGSLFAILLGSLGIYAKWKDFGNAQKSVVIWAQISLITVVFLMNYRSIFVWDNLPLIGYFQFPWRFLTLAVFISALLIVGLDKMKFKNIIAGFLMLVSIWAGWTYFEPNDFLGRTDSYYLDRYIPFPKASEAYLLIQEEYLRLPTGTTIRPDKLYPTIFPENQLISVHKINDLNVVFTSKSDQYLKLNFNKYFFPGWKGYIDGNELLLKPGDPFGQITFEVPSGQHEIKIVFQETSFKKLIDIISGISLMVVLGFIFSSKFKKKYE